MASQNRITLKSYFETGDSPTESNFKDLIDSFLLVTESAGSIDWTNVNSKPTTLSGYGITDAVNLTSTQTLTNKTLTNPKINVGSDATGDLYYRDASGNFTRLAIGTSAQVLKGGTTPAYASISAVLGYTPLNQGGDTMTGLLILSGDPVSASGAATKSYVDNLITGLTWKQSVAVATTANITLSGTQTIDGIAVIAGDRVLVKDQTTASQNGIYVVASGSWTRAADNDSGAEIASTTVLSESGTVNAGTQWNCSNTTITLDTTSVTFVKVAGAGVYINGTGISLSGNVFSLDTSVAATLTGTQTLTNKTLTTPVISTITNTGTLTLPTATDTLVGRTTTDTLTNKTLTGPKINVSSDTTGDIYYRDASGNFTRLAIGTSSQVLKGGTTPAYATIPSILGYTPVNQAGDTMTGALILNANPSTGLGAATKNYVDTVVTGRGIPIGASIEYCGTADLNPDPDTGAVYFLEDGRAISRTTYATLFARLGTTYGAGNGTTTFNIPDTRECFVIGYKSGSSISPSLGFKAGASTKTIANSNLPTTSPWSIVDNGHVHQENGSSNTGSDGGLVGAGGSGSGGTYLNTSSSHTGITLGSNSGGGQAMNIMNPYIVKGKFIRVL